jgi:hypothetical protein
MRYVTLYDKLQRVVAYERRYHEIDKINPRGPRKGQAIEQHIAPGYEAEEVSQSWHQAKKRNTAIGGQIQVPDVYSCSRFNLANESIWFYIRDLNFPTISQVPKF